jgi:hypothetical protein
MGEGRANLPVVVTIAGIEANQNGHRPVPIENWHRFVSEMYGSCADLGLEEPDDLPLQDRSFDE